MLESCLLASSKKVDMCISLTGPPPSWSCCTRIDSHRLVHSHQKADHMDPERMFKPKGGAESRVRNRIPSLQEPGGQYLARGLENIHTGVFFPNSFPSARNRFSNSVLQLLSRPGLYLNLDESRLSLDRPGSFFDIHSFARGRTHATPVSFRRSLLLSCAFLGGGILKANEAIPMAPFSKRHSHLPDDDDGPCSVIRGEELMEIRRKYSISPSVELSFARGRTHATPVSFRRSLLLSCAFLGGDILKANEAIPMAPFSKRHSHLPDDDDGPCSVIRGEELMEIRRKYSISPSVELRLQRRQLTPLTWRELIAIQVLGEFHGILFGTSEILYSYYFAPLIGKKGFYHIRSGDGNPLSFWLSSVLAFAVYRHVSFAGEASVRLAMEIPKRFRRDEYHKAKTWKRHPYSPLMPRFDFAVSPTGSSSSLPTTVSEWLEKKFDHWNPEEEYR
ncbi:hypothetical protein F2Q70_00011671 [Brassica cretica]|uniref:Uncharacterized protein n=1 Tax=Brassica cretica TaxID=69181 RepID=A0A8S9LXF7_BRACR|nr:hypothetical protein F2Q70_00011671 [Brassica cretica]